MLGMCLLSQISVLDNHTHAHKPDKRGWGAICNLVNEDGGIYLL